MSRKTKAKAKGFSYRLLFLSILLGIASVATVVLIALLFRGYKIEWESLLVSITGSIGVGIAINQQNKPHKKNGDNPNTDFDPSPVKPKPYNPPPFQDLREMVEDGRQWGNPKPLEPYKTKAKPKINPLPNLDKNPARVAPRLSCKDYLELSHNDKIPNTFTPPVVQKFIPKHAPYKVISMLNGDEKQALRLYEGITNRFEGRDERWIWEKVMSDLERDRR